ncbi:bestrophin family protein [Kluyvera cryocrescens]|uniref:bestrophin family protein n=1 Tax=Kluyvera cryocrescens TaxID=580 RepID=UPI0028A90D3D|nr:bestrophin family ion channel [Kluyvera cryocrescens]
MIVRPEQTWFRKLFSWRGSIMRKISPQLCFFIMLNIAYLFMLPLLHLHGIIVKESSFYFIGISISISVFLGFRNNTAWLRYWEARKLWGDLLIVNRSLMREIMTTTQTTQQEKKVVLDLMVTYCETLKSKLRHGPVPVGRALDYQHLTTPCNALLQNISQWLYQHRPNEFVYRNFNTYLNQISAIQGGCERISNTPIPYAYSLLLHRTVGIFCAVYPLLLIHDFGFLTLLFSIFTTYALLALDAIATELEDPFGTEDNDLPLKAICNAIEIDLREMLKESVVPVKIKPDAHYRLL